MAADGSVVIEIKGDADELLAAFRKISGKAEDLEGDIQGIANKFKQAATASKGIDGDGLDDAARSADRLGDNLKGASSGASRLADIIKGSFVGGLAASAVQMVGDAFLDLGREALTAADSLTKFGSTMSFAGFDAQTVESSKQAVQDYAARTVYDLETVANTTAQLAANGIQDFVGLTEAAGNLNAVAGGNASTFQSVAMMLTQTAGAGKLTTENWNQLADAIPGASGKLQEAMLANGAYTGNFRDAMAEGQITAEEFNQAIMQLGMSDTAIEAASSVATIEGAIGNLKATIVDGIAGVLTGGGGMEAITGFINGLTETISQAGQYISPAIDGIKSAFAGIGETFRNTFTGEQQAAIMGFFDRLGSALVGLPFQLVSAAASALSLAFQALITVAGALVDFFGSIPDAVNAVAEGFNEFVSSVGQSFTEAYNEIVAWGSNTISSISNTVSNAVSTAANFFGQLPAKISSALSGALSALVAWGSNMVNNARSAMSNVVNSIGTTLRTAISQVVTIGGQIIQGLINGIKAKASAVVSALKDVVSSAINAAKNALGIASPSKVFAEIGSFTSQGFAVGIESGMRYVTKSVDSLASETKSQVESLNAEIEKMETEAAERAAKAELEAHKKALAEQYKKLETAELDEREEIQEKIAELESDWNDKQLKEQEEAQKKALESRIDALEKTEDAYRDAMETIHDALDEFNGEYQDALKDVASSRDSLAGELSEFALYDDFEGEMHLWDLGPMIDQINEYGDTIEALQDRGVNESLLNEILEMDRSEATRFGQELLSMSESQYEQYMDMWQQKEDVAARVAQAVYQGEMDAIEMEYAEKLPEMMADTADQAMAALAENLEGTGQDAVAAAAKIADEVIAEIERINATQRLQNAVLSASASFGGQLAGNVQNAEEGRTAARRTNNMEVVGTAAMLSNSNSSREIVLNLNGKEVARGLVPDIRAVEDQSPRIVSD